MAKQPTSKVTMHSSEVIVKPVVSEKATNLREKNNVVSFEIHLKATKSDVRHAMKEIWGVEALRVRTAIRAGKPKSRGRHVYQTKKTKRAMVSLVEGTKLPFFEEV